MEVKITHALINLIEEIDVAKREYETAVIRTMLDYDFNHYDHVTIQNLSSMDNKVIAHGITALVANAEIEFLPPASGSKFHRIQRGPNWGKHVK